MAVGETTLTMVGNVCSDLTRRAVGEGVEVVSFWLRSNERRFDKDAGTWGDGRHFAVRVTCWRTLAAGAFASLSKGDPVIVNGRLHTSEYDAGGQVRSMPELEAVALGPNLQWSTATVRRNGRKAAAAEPWSAADVTVGSKQQAPAA
ncbi:single-stranded DNA-binding protein [Amycolatopsis antarctica]|uniref:Single-stranded DNA-binding protein n=1 Tax=Amycolatopsis antarctica TaxID=1854586 RepID=A0A263D046_9PSEU|nr:single-stranded DNA-binding protein [Amycolatopsis antarctica]OZM71589.1 single-stranded DNA-binding protein [Amycolatopsis antarctica]